MEILNENMLQILSLRPEFIKAQLMKYSNYMQKILT